MLINFTVANYRSIKEPITLSMEAENRILGLEKENLIEIPDGRKLINAAAIYGANASGKSNLIKAVHFMRSFVLDSSKESQQGDPISTEPFLLSDEKEEEQPSHFEIECLVDGIVYEYGFEVTQTEVTKEWLYGSPKGRKVAYFEREGQRWSKMSPKYFKKEGAGLESKTRSDALFLSTVAQFNGETAKKIVGFLRKVDGPKQVAVDSFATNTASMLSKDTRLRKVISHYLSTVDIGITSLHICNEFPGSDDKTSHKGESLERTAKRFFASKRIKTIHKTPSGREVEFDLLDQESSGSQKLLMILDPIINSMISKGVQVFDEIESSMHPLLVMGILRLFQVNALNIYGSQIIFTTHDTNLLSQQSKLLRRDQIWFTEKKPDFSTDLYCLSEFKPKNDAAYDKNYLRGRYGAVPYLGDLGDLLEQES